jgi:hypothetical protein
MIFILSLFSLWMNPAHADVCNLPGVVAKVGFYSVSLGNAATTDTARWGDGKVTSAERLTQIIPTSILKSVHAFQKQICSDKGFIKSVNELSSDFEKGTFGMEFTLHASNSSSMVGAYFGHYGSLKDGRKYDSAAKDVWSYSQYPMTAKGSKDLINEFKKMVKAARENHKNYVAVDQNVDVEANKKIIDEYLK